MTPRFTFFRPWLAPLYLLVLMSLALVLPGCSDSDSSSPTPKPKTGTLVLDIVGDISSLRSEKASDVSLDSSTMDLVVDFFLVADNIRLDDIAFTFSQPITPTTKQVTIENVPIPDVGLKYEIIGRIFTGDLQSQPFKFVKNITIEPDKTDVEAVEITSGYLAKMILSPSASVIAINGQQVFSVYGIYNDNTRMPVPANYLDWSTDKTSVIEIIKHGTIEGKEKGVATVKVKDPKTRVIAEAYVVVKKDAPTLRRISIEPSNLTLPAGKSSMYTAIGFYNDGSNKNISKEVIWNSSDSEVASFNLEFGGYVTAHKAGTSTISAYDPTTKIKATPVTLTVKEVTLESIEIQPSLLEIASGVTEQFTAQGIYSDKSTMDLTYSVTWASSDPKVLTISNLAQSKGKATSVSPGKAEISATYEGVKSKIASVTVTDVTLKSIQITPYSSNLSVGETTAFKATGIFSDNSSADITEDAQWSSSNDKLVTVSNVSPKGEAKAIALGTATIKASFNDIEAIATVTVGTAPVTLKKIEVTPTTPTVAKGLTQQFTATGIYSNNTTKNLTDQVTWQSSDEEVATISNLPDTNGSATALKEGTTDITATFQGKTSTPVNFEVTAAELQSIEVTPVINTVAKGLPVQFTATGIYTDGNHDITNEVTWASETESVATISNADGSHGKAATLAEGTTNITAAYKGKTSTEVTLTVTAAELKSIQVTSEPSTASVPKGLPIQFTATGIYTDGNHNITNEVTWTSETESVAKISNAEGSKGKAATLAEGTTNITAAYGEEITSEPVTLTVTAAELKSIQVTSEPSTASVPKGLPVQFIATGIYTDGEHPITNEVTWASETESVATISNADGSKGLAATLAEGTTNITAAYKGKTSNEVTLKVTAAELKSIQVTSEPPTASVPKGLPVQFTATGIYTDGEHPITNEVTWTSETESVAKISNADGSKGKAATLAEGTTNITAAYKGKTSNEVTLKVTAATLKIISVTPTTTIAKGLTAQFEALGIYTDNSNKNITDEVTWASETESVATISNSDGSPGLATGKGIGETKITAKYGETLTSDPVTLTVTEHKLQDIQITTQEDHFSKLPIGITRQFIANGRYSDNTSNSITGEVTWTSSNDSIATISNAVGSKGLLETKNQGEAKIKATWTDSTSGDTIESDEYTINIDASLVLQSIQVYPGTDVLITGMEKQFRALGTYTAPGPYVLDITKDVEWSSNNESAISFTQSPGEARTYQYGEAVVSASKSSIEAKSYIIVYEYNKLTNIIVTPDQAEGNQGSTIQFTATAIYDGSSLDVTKYAKWISERIDVATISNEYPNKGLATIGDSSGDTTIKATFGDEYATAVLTAK